MHCQNHWYGLYRQCRVSTAQATYINECLSETFGYKVVRGLHPSDRETCIIGNYDPRVVQTYVKITHMNSDMKA